MYPYIHFELDLKMNLFTNEKSLNVITDSIIKCLKNLSIHSTHVCVYLYKKVEHLSNNYKRCEKQRFEDTSTPLLGR